MHNTTLEAAAKSKMAYTSHRETRQDLVSVEKSKLLKSTPSHTHAHTFFKAA